MSISVGDVELIHTCYRDHRTSTAPSRSTRRSDSRSAAGFRSATRRSTSSWALPGDADRLELTYNFGVDSYEIGTATATSPVTVDDLDATARARSPAGHRARASAVLGARGRLATVAFVRDPDEYRIELIERGGQ
jgi:lactoylglutathione lyase